MVSCFHGNFRSPALSCLRRGAVQGLGFQGFEDEGEDAPLVVSLMGFFLSRLFQYSVLTCFLRFGSTHGFVAVQFST